MPAKTTAAPTDSAPNAARDKEWKREIHTPDALYNASVPMADIERDPANRVPSDEAVAALAQAIEAEGLLQPVVLQQLASGTYRLIAGEHRWRAFQLLKRETIPARIYKSETELSAARKALLENNAREGLSPIERARRFAQLQELGMKQKEIGALAGGISQPVVANALRLLELPAEVQEMITAGKLSEAHGVALAKWAKWPRVCACMARMALDHGYSAKEIAQDGFPFAGQCVNEGLLEEIRIKDRYLSDGPIYKLPRHFYSHRDFIISEYKAYYVIPENEDDNVWAPERLKQDKEREAQETARLAREARAAAKSGGLSADAIARKKKIAENKARRASHVESLRLALDKLKRTPSPTTLLLAILSKEALKGNYGGKRIAEAAESVNVTLPKDALTEGCYGLNKIELMRGMNVMDLTRVTVATIITREIEYACRNAWDLPPAVEAVMNAEVPVSFGVGDEVEWDSRDARTGQPKVKRGTVLSDADYIKAGGFKQSVGPEFLPIKLSDPDSVYDCPFNGIRKDGLRLVKSAAPAELIKLTPQGRSNLAAKKAGNKKGRK